MKETREQKIYDALCSYDDSHKVFDFYEMARWINNRIKVRKR